MLLLLYSEIESISILRLLAPDVFAAKLSRATPVYIYFLLTHTILVDIFNKKLKTSNV